MLEVEVTNIRFYIDLISDAAKRAGLKNCKVNYARLTPSCTMTYREANLRKFTELKSIMEQYTDVQVKYPETIIINNATSPGMLQKLIIWKLSELEFAEYKNVNIISVRTHIAFTKSAYEKAKNKDIIERTFNKTETETEILFEINDNVFKLQHQFIKSECTCE